MTIGREFLRSINLTSDLSEPERFSHCQPTQKSLRVIQAVLDGKPNSATMVVASYGTGKSLAAGVGALIVKNSLESQKVLQPIIDRIASINPDEAKQMKKRVGSKNHGMVFVLHGYIPNLPRELSNQAQLLSVFQNTRGLFVELKNSLKRRKLDRIAIIWDEFGRHLEGLVADGQPSDLIHVQELAEWVCRQGKLGASLTLLLHQNFLNYTSGLNQTARYEWRKVEGRFASLRFVEDSREMYELIGRAIASARPQKTPSEILQNLTTDVSRSIELGLFRDFEEKELESLLDDVWPLTPSVLYVLPQLSSRVAQNERSIFTFLNDSNLSQAVTLEHVYKYFSEVMRCDTGLGGTYRRWLETESARSRVSSDLEKEILAAACLLQLGTNGERLRLSRAQLTFAVSAGTNNEEGQKSEIENVIDDLIERKLLLHRLRNDDISIWHGADIDIRSRIDEEKARCNKEFELERFLISECPPPYERPLRHNIDSGINRYWGGRYVYSRELLSSGSEHSAFKLLPGEDGRLIYCIAENPSEIKKIKKFAQTSMPDDPGIVMVVPNRPVDATDACLELFCLLRLHNDRNLIDSDPLVLPELKELTSVARSHVHRIFSQLIDPTKKRATYYSRKKAIRVDETHLLSEQLSKLAEERFPKTPKIINEQIMRHKVTRSMIIARKKTILGILERTGCENLGFTGMTTPDASIYRTVLERTGLYRYRRGMWSWVNPSEIKDPGLKEIWEILHKFFSDPSEESKCFSEIIKRLILPPYGLRRGVLPILISAGIRAFGQAIVIRNNGEYLPDILASEIEEICQFPERFTIEVIKLTQRTSIYLKGIITEFGGDEECFNDELIRGAFDSIMTWKSQLPKAAFEAKISNNSTHKMQRALKKSHDPIELLFHSFISLSGAKSPGEKALIGIREARHDLERVVDGFSAQAIEGIRKILTVGSNGKSDILAKAKMWADCFDDEALPLNMLDLPSRSLLSRAREATNGRYTEASFARAISLILLGRGFEQWDDRTVDQFSRTFRSHVERIEQTLLESGTLKPIMAPLIQSKIQQLVVQLRTAVGSEKTEQLLEHLKQNGAGL